MTSKTCLLVTSEILRLFVNTLTADGSYCCYKSQKFWGAIQMKLCKKRKICYQIFVAFVESTSDFQHVEKKHQTHTKLLTPKDLLTYMS